MKKLLYLFLALLLPALIFVFLKYAGKNEFDIPVYFEEGVPLAPTDCSISYSRPYVLPDSVVGSMGALQAEASIAVFHVPGAELDRLQTAIDDEFGTGTVGIKDACQIAGSSTRCNAWEKCIFMVNDPLQAVLFDKQKKIRGYYDLSTREEVDRLRVELKVLLKKY